MANDLVGLQEHKALLALALDLKGWEGAEARPGDPAQAVAILDRWLVPMKDSEALNGEGARRLVSALRPIGAKIAPTMSEEQVQVWLSAMVAALSDLPTRIAIRAAQDALHSPLRFINEVETVIREKAQDARRRYDLARHRLERMARDLARPAQPRLLPPEMSDEELQSMPEYLRRMGINAGWLRQDADGRLSWIEEEKP